MREGEASMIDVISLATERVPQYMNINRAMFYGGYDDPEIIITAIERREIVVDESVIQDKDIFNLRHHMSWIRIESRSFFRWLSIRDTKSIKKIGEKYDKIIQGQINLLCKLGFVQHAEGTTAARLDKLDQRVFENNRLLRTLITLLVSEETAMQPDSQLKFDMKVA